MKADLYLDRIDFLHYLPRTDCAQCMEGSCRAFLDAILRGNGLLDGCPNLSDTERYAFYIALRAEDLLPKVPVLQIPRVGFTGLYEINDPKGGNPIIVSGNSETTQEVLLALFCLTKSPFFILFADSRGNTVDMAMIFKTFTAERIVKAIQESSIPRDTAGGTLVLPGLASPVVDTLRDLLSWKIDVGPICAGELPLFLGDRWGPSP